MHGEYSFVDQNINETEVQNKGKGGVGWSPFELEADEDDVETGYHHEVVSPQVKSACSFRVMVAIFLWLMFVLALGHYSYRSAYPTVSIVSISIPPTHDHPSTSMRTFVYIPTSFAGISWGRYPVMVYSHGRPPFVGDDESPVLMGHVKYWQSKGYAVVAGLRPGYEKGGTDREWFHDTQSYVVAGVRHLQCQTFDDTYTTLENSISNGVVTTNAVVDWVKKQSWAQHDKIVLEGSSVGGVVAVLAAANSTKGIVGVINFSGGHGGNIESGRSCASNELNTLFHLAGTATHIRSLWLYASNDLFWGNDDPRKWYQSFLSGLQTADHPAKSDFHLTKPVGANGHFLLKNGGRLWSGHTDKFISSLD